MVLITRSLCIKSHLLCGVECGIKSQDRISAFISFSVVLSALGTHAFNALRRGHFLHFGALQMT